MKIELRNEFKLDRQHKRRLNKKLVFKRRIYFFKEYCRTFRRFENVIGYYSKPKMPKGLPLYKTDY